MENQADDMKYFHPNEIETLQCDNEQFILYSPDSLKYITDEMEDVLSKTLDFYQKLFDINFYRKFQINFFDDLHKFREYVYTIRGSYPPEYARGVFDKGMITATIPTEQEIITQEAMTTGKSPAKIDHNNPTYRHYLHLPSHELFHIIYKELILEKENQKRIVWFDEGMAKLFSGESDHFLSKENFPQWINDLLNKTKEFPELNELEHGDKFRNEKYDGYKLSLLSVKYLYDILGQEKFKKLMHDENQITKYGETVLTDAINYFQTKLKLKSKSESKSDSEPGSKSISKPNSKLKQNKDSEKDFETR